jgi:AcrR family transcriptional regulator
VSTPSSKRPRGRPAIPAEVQRARLLSAARRAFQKEGYEKTRVADIVREAGMSSRSFYEFFDSKDDLVAAVVQEQGRAFIRRLQEIFEKANDPLERIDRGLRAYLDLFTAWPVDLERMGGRAGARVREARRGFVREITEMVVRELALLHAAGRVSRLADPVGVELILTGIEGISFRYYSEGRIGELQALRSAFVDLLVRAFL